jgi:two-component system sensor histidine kinase/response regulator
MIKLSKKIRSVTDRFINEIYQETGYPVVISDSDGRIIQATDKKRVGTVHTGAKKLMAVGYDEFAITAEQAASDPLVKEGYGAAIVVDGKKIAAFGITGPVEITKPLVRIAGRMMNAWISDLKKQEQLELSEKKYRSIFDNSTQGIFQSTFEGKFITANKALANLFGYETPEQFMEQVESIPDLYKNPEERAKLVSQLSKNNSVKDFNAELRHADGYFIDINLSAHVISNPETHVSFIEGIVEDITEKVKSAQLKIERDAATKANEAKSLFLANMSHEIRTPMNGVIGMSEILLETPLTKEQTELAKTIKESGDALLSIINDILDYSKIESGNIDLETIDFDLRATLDSVGSLLSIKAHQNGIEFATVIDPEVPSLLKGDPGRTRQILINLAGNAVKFTHKGEVAVYVTVEKETSEHVRLKFRIKDTGIGIAQNKMHRLFSFFSQVDSSTTRKYGGTGLGLSISKRLVQLMDGDIGVRSREGEGSEFWFTALFQKQNKMKAPLPATDQVKNRAVLVVDGNKTNRFLITRQLKQWGCLYDETASGPEALDKLTAAAQAGNPFDLAIIGMQIPGMAGETLGRRIKESTSLEKTRLILMTSMGKRGDANALEKIGFDAYLTKPIKTGQLYECLKRVYARPRNPPALLGNIITKHSLSEDERRKIRILIAEDNVINQKVALRTLTKLGYRADVVDNGLKAVTALKRTSYDLVLMDCQMPELDGYNATQSIRQAGSGVKNSKIPVIAMTAHAMKGDRDKCIAAGMDDYLTKPVKGDVLSAMLEKWLTRSRP